MTTLKSKEVQEFEAYARQIEVDGLLRVKVPVNGQQEINIVTKKHRFERFLPVGPCHLPYRIQFLEDAFMFKDRSRPEKSSFMADLTPA